MIDTSSVVGSGNSDCHQTWLRLEIHHMQISNTMKIWGLQMDCSVLP